MRIIVRNVVVMQEDEAWHWMIINDQTETSYFGQTAVNTGINDAVQTISLQQSLISILQTRSASILTLNDRLTHSI